MTMPHDTGTEGIPVALSPRQARIVRELRRRIGPGPAVMFREACGLAREEPKRLTVTHLVAHLLREVESAVRAVMEPPNAGMDAASDRHQAKIRAVLSELGISERDPVAELWLSLAGSGSTLNLAGRAHRTGLDAPRSWDVEFDTLVDVVEQVLDTVLERFNTNYFRVFEELDKALATPTPNRGDAAKVRNRIPNNQAVSHYFFSRASVAWLDPLRRAGFFTTPPQAEVDEDGDFVQLPTWPESAYLARVGRDDPAMAVDAAVAIPSSDNPRVYHDIVTLALAVPAEQAARLVPTIVDGIRGRFGMLIPQTVGQLVVHLSQGDQPEAGMTLATALLDKLPSPTVRRTAGYDRILREHVPTLVRAAGVPALALLAGTLMGSYRSGR
jgi:hypothetical protein